MSCQHEGNGNEWMGFWIFLTFCLFAQPLTALIRSFIK